jgi:hypothetical protein
MGFFSKMMTSKPSAKAPSSRRRKDSAVGGDVRDPAGLATREMMAKAERELYQFEAPVQELGLSDLVAKHKAGDRFQYLALTGGESETYEARMRRMVTFRPRVSKKLIPLDQLPHIKLVKDAENLCLTDILPKKGEEYTRIHAVSGYFAPTVSVMAKFSRVKVALMDSRFDPPAEVQSVTMNTNMDAKIELSMDYCIPRSSSDKLGLMIVREQATMSYGEQWGALQAQIQLEECSFPYMSDMKRVVGILGPTASALEDYEVNPNVLDITMTENNRRMLRELYQQGDIADEGDPIIEKKKAIKYAKSTIKGLPKGEVVEANQIERAGWDFMKGSRKPQVAAEEASDEPSDEGDDDSDYNPVNRLKSKDAWEQEQERLRQGFDVKSDTTEEIPRPGFHPFNIDASLDRPTPLKTAMKVDGTASLTKEAPKRGVNFGVGGV